MATASSACTQVFISYNYADKEWLERLNRHLKPLVREGMDCWDDTRIQPGTDWQQEIRHALDTAQVAVLLISASFFASDFIATNELPPLLVAAQTKGVHILPVILSTSRFARHPDLAHFQAVNSPDKPLDALPRSQQEKVFDQVAQTIESVLNRAEEQSYSDPDSPFTADPPYNPVPECAELMAGTTQGSTRTLFDLLPELRFGREEFEIDELSISISYGVKETALHVKLKACWIKPGPRLGDDRDKHPSIIAKGNNTWEIKGPKENGILMRRALGSEPICHVSADGEIASHVTFELTCRGRDVHYKIFGKGAENLSITEARILEIFLNKCLNAERGIVMLSRATLSVRDDTS